VSRVYFGSETAHVELKSGRVQGPTDDGRRRLDGFHADVARQPRTALRRR